VRGQVNQTLSLSLKDILQGLPRVDIAAVNQCAALRGSTPNRALPALNGPTVHEQRDLDRCASQGRT